MKIYDLPIVYVLEASGTSLYKIGMTKNLTARLSSIQVGCPFKLSIFRILYTREPKKLEAEIHNAFAESRFRGEWFVFEDSELDALCDLCEEQTNKIRKEFGYAVV